MSTARLFIYSLVPFREWTISPLSKGCDSQGGHGVASVLELSGISQDETA